MLAQERTCIIPKRTLRRVGVARGGLDYSSEFALMEFNILGERRVTSLGRAASEYKTAMKKEVFAWEYRKQHVLAEVRRYAPDVVVLGGVEDFEGFLNPRLAEMGYGGSFKQRCTPNGPSASGGGGGSTWESKEAGGAGGGSSKLEDACAEGVAIFYKLSRFSLASVRTVSGSVHRVGRVCVRLCAPVL